MAKGLRATLALLAALACGPAALAQTRAGGEFTVNTYTTNTQSRPAAAMLRDGGFVIVWQSAYQDGSSLGIFGQRYAADGSPAGSEFRVNAYVTGVQQLPQVAALPSGGSVVAWSGHGPSDPDEGVYARRLDSAGAPVGSDFLVNTTTAGTQWRQRSRPAARVVSSWCGRRWTTGADSACSGNVTMPRGRAPAANSR